MMKMTKSLFPADYRSGKSPGFLPEGCRSDVTEKRRQNNKKHIIH